jgi:hypothetical protein
MSANPSADSTFALLPVEASAPVSPPVDTGVVACVVLSEAVVVVVTHSVVEVVSAVVVEVVDEVEAVDDVVELELVVVDVVAEDAHGAAVVVVVLSSAVVVEVVLDVEVVLLDVELVELEVVLEPVVVVVPDDEETAQVYPFGSVELAVKVTSPLQLSTTWLGGELAPPGLNAGLLAKHATPTSHVAVVALLLRPRSLG